MISGATVTVKHPVQGAADRFGNATYTWKDEDVDNVLIAPGATDDLEASRPEGADIALTLHFPKTYSGSLAGCSVVLPSPWAGTYRVVGDPMQYMDANTPTPWHMPVEVERVYG